MFIVGCVEKDILDIDITNINDIEEPVLLESDLEISTITYNEIPNVIDDLFSNLGKTNKQIIANKIKHNNVIIDLKEIKKTINKNTPGESSYSFALFVESASINHIYNLIIEEDKKGKFKKHYVVGFEMEPEDIDSFFMTGEDYSQFTSTYRFYTFDSFFQDSKVNRVGKSGDCGSGTTGGSGDIQYNAPGTTLTNSYNGHIITTTFSTTTVSTTYNYNSTIVSNGTVNTVSTVSQSVNLEITTNVPSAPIYMETVSAGTVQVSSSYNPQGSGGTGCTNIMGTHPDGGIYFKLCAVPDNNQNKSTLTAYGSDCTNGSGTFAINTAAKPVYKLSAALQGILTFGQFEWFTDAQHTERLSFASELVWFLIDNGNTNENIEFVLMAIDAVMDGGSVDVDEKIINELTGKAKCVYDKVFSKNITSLGIMQQTYIAFNPDLNYKEHYLTYSSKPLSGTINGETKVNSPISYEIILNDQTLNNRAPIEIARTILHESVHALLLKQAYGDGTESFIQIFKNYISSTTGNNDLHHNIMRDKYIIPIAKGLEKYDNSSEDFSYYEHLAYFGLHQELNQQQLHDLNNAQNLARSKGLNCQ
tara:strand:- start:602 stop:2371 length:1770 start_codon:yes stop_codon:yes gene_type:complete